MAHLRFEPGAMERGRRRPVLIRYWNRRPAPASGSYGITTRHLCQTARQWHLSLTLSLQVKTEASLFAILLDDDHYAFIMAGCKESDGLPWVGEAYRLWQGSAGR